MINTYLTFSLPEDHESDELRILESSTKDGNYSHHLTKEYKYGQSKVEVQLDPERWYRIQFHNNKLNQTSQVSEPVFAGTYIHGAPVVFVSSNTDGAHYATTQDVYDYAGLEPQDVPETRVSVALKKARANIDYKVNDIRSDAFLTYDDNVQNRKYNAALQIIHEAEICLALGHVYDSMSDKLILESMRDIEGQAAPGVSVGGTSMSGDPLGHRSESILYMATLGAKYRAEGQKLLSMVDPTTVPLVSYEDHVRSPRFKYPFHGWPR